MKRLAARHLAMLFLLAGARSFAYLPSSYILDEDGTRIPSPQGYVVEKAIDGRESAAGPFNQPKGLFIDGEDNIFIADTNNNRVLKFDPSGKLVMQLTSAASIDFSGPQGVFVDYAGLIYIADTNNSRIVKLDAQGSLLREYPKPDSPFLKDIAYLPTEVVVDRRDFMYVVNSQGDFRGILQIDGEGKFRGFFAPNRLAFDIRRILIRLLASKEQRDKIKSEVPPADTGLIIDQDSFIYTVSPGADKDQIKKLNTLGLNVYPSKFYGEEHGDDHEPISPRFYAIGLDSVGGIFAYDATTGRIYNYDQSGNLLFIFGGKGNQKGSFRNVASIKVDREGKVYVLDGVASRIQVFAPTTFAEQVAKANSLYYQGEYQKAETPWKEVLKYDSNYLLARRGLGKAYLKQARFVEARDEFFYGNDKEGYSNAFKEIRYRFIRQNLGWVFLAVLGATAIIYGIVRFASWLVRLPHRSAVWLRIVQQAVGIIRRPGATLEELKEEGSWLSLVPLLALYYVVGVLRLKIASFHFSTVDPRQVSFVLQGFRLFVPWISWCVISYAICTISDGKGFFKDVLVSSAFSLAPFILFSLPVALLSHILILEQATFYNALNILILAWVLFLLFNQLRVVQDFTVRKSIGVYLLTALGIGFAWAGCVLVYGLTDQVAGFARDVIAEVVIR